MATLQQRVAARGFPVFDVSGQSGQGALPDSTRPGTSVPGQPTATWTDPNIDLASVAAQLPPPEEYVALGEMRWGLPAGVKPDDTPRTHAAPMADPTLAWQDGARKNSEGILAYNEELLAVHDPGFNGWEIRHHPGVNRHMQYADEVAAGSPDGPLQRLTGQVRSMGGYDGVQGYGGFVSSDLENKGVNGTNATMPLTVNNIDFPGETFHGVFLNAAEVPFLVADADQFIPAAPEFGQWLGGGFDGPTAAVQAQQPIVADAPAQGPQIAAGSGLLPLWRSY